MKVAILGDSLRQQRMGQVVTGYNVAVHDLLNSYIRYAESDLFCCCEPDTYQEDMIRRMIANTGVANGNVRRIVSEYDLLFNRERVQEGFDILHSVKEDPIPLISMRDHLQIKAPLTFTIHSLAEQHMLTDTIYPLLLLPFQPYDAILCSSEAVIRTISRMMDRLEDMGLPVLKNRGDRGQRIRLEKMPLGVDTDVFRPTDRQQARAELGLPQDAFILLWFGRLSNLFKADLHPALQVFKRLVQENPNKKLFFVLAGGVKASDSDSIELQRFAMKLGIEGHVRFIDQSEIRNKASIYAAADVFTSPIDNIQETFGLTPIEAMACGIPQVVSDWDGYRDTVEDGVTGFRIRTYWMNCMEDVATADYLPTNIQRRRDLMRYLAVQTVAVDCEEYYQKLQFLMDHPEVRLSMAHASREKAEQVYSLKKAVFNTEQVWRELSECARKEEMENFSVRIPMIDYCNDFSGFPTMLLDENGTELCLTDFGQTAEAEDLYVHPLFKKEIAEAQLIPIMLQWIKAKGSFPLNEMIYAAFPDWTKAQIKRCIMFFVKHNVLRIC